MKKGTPAGIVSGTVTKDEEEDMQRNEGAADKACREIRRLIINYEYKPGDRLYEPTLAESMNMSRTPIREALTRLVSSGFLERDPHRRGYKVPFLTQQDMLTAFRLRLMLEEYAVRLAVTRVTPADIEFLYAINDEEKRLFFEENRTMYSEMNEKFHLTLAEKSGDPYLLRYIEELVSRATLYGVFFAAFYIKALRGNDVNARKSPAYVEHRLVIDALAAGDEEAAGEAVRNHMFSTYTHYTNHAMEDVIPKSILTLPSGAHGAQLSDPEG